MTETHRLLIGRNTAERTRFFVKIELRQEPGSGRQTIEHEPVPDTYIELSMTYEEVNHRGEFESGGAGWDWDVDSPAPGWTPEQIAELAAIGKRWHLNGLKAGCAHQRVEYETDPYGGRRPSLTETKPCPHTDYRYGSAWLVELLPQDVIDRIRQIANEHREG
jgi:hypothetical protein